MSGRRVRLSFVQFWALRCLVDLGGVVNVYTLAARGMQWPNRAAWFEHQTFRALVRKQLVTLREDRVIAVTEDGRRVLEKSQHFTRSTIQL